MRLTRILFACCLSLSSGSAFSQSATDLVYTTFSQPCRIVDTRLGGGALVPAVPRNLKVAGTTGFEAQGGTSGGCGVPDSARAAFLNFVAVSPAGGGNLRAVAYPDSFPATGSILNYQALNPNLNVANGVLFPICDHSSPCAADITVQPNGAGTHLIIDVLGFSTADHKHSGDDITTGVVADANVAASIARDNEILPTILDSDGPGSGIDADLLDGQQPSDFASAVHSHDSSYQAKYQRTVVVTSGGAATANGSALRNAIDAITDASLTNRYLIRIEPGIFDLGGSALTMKSFVDIEGAGESSTIIRRPGQATASSGAVIGANDAEVRFLTIENTGGTAFAVALYLNATSPHLVHVTLLASGASTSLYGLHGTSTSTRLIDVTSRVSGTATYGYAFYFVSSPGIELTGVTGIADSPGVGLVRAGLHLDHSPGRVSHSLFRASNGYQTNGINVTGVTSPIFSGVRSEASGNGSFNIGVGVAAGRLDLHGIVAIADGPGQTCVGLLVQGGSDATVTGAELQGTGCTYNYGVLVGVTTDPANTITVHNSRLTGAFNAIEANTNYTVRVGNSQLIGGAVSPHGGTVTCTYVVDENFAGFSGSCP